MLKRILLTLLMVCLAAYLVLAITAFNRKPDSFVCTDVELIIRDSVNAGFITKQEIIGLLKKQGINPIGKELAEVRSKPIEELLSNHSLIDKVECYKTPSGKVCVEATQRIPILRIMSSNGEDYYIDHLGVVMPSSAKCVAHLPVATGKIEKAFATMELHDFALYLQQNSFWRAQIAQIHVLPGGKVELVPRVGDHIIYLGRLTDVERKLDRVKAFYQKALNRVGWNKYSRINVEMGNQIVCTKQNN